MRNILKSNSRPVHGAKTGRARRVPTGLSRLILDRAVNKAVQSIQRKPVADACLLRDIGLSPSDVERLASELHVLTADPYGISLKPNASSIEPKPRSRCRHFPSTRNSSVLSTTARRLL
jgi:hypothetical protein